MKLEAWSFAVSKHGTSQKTPIQNIEDWLSDNERLGFEKSKQMIQSISRVANFREKTSSITQEEKDLAKSELKKYEADKQTLQVEKQKDDDETCPF